MPDFVSNVIGSLFAALILIAIAFLKRKAIRELVTKWRYLIVARRNLRDLKQKTQEHCPEVQALITRIAFTTVTHLFKSEEITLDEYGDLLEMSLNKNLKECIFIARTKPSQWYPVISSNEISEDERGVRKIHLERRIQEYFEKQKEIKHDLKCELKIRRYIMLSKTDWDGDSKKRKFIEDHRNAGIELFLCDLGMLSKSFGWNDVAIFVSKQKRKWSVVGLNFNEKTIEKYLNGAETWINVKIEEGALLDSDYAHKLRMLDRIAEQVVPLGQKFYYQLESS